MKKLLVLGVVLLLVGCNKGGVGGATEAGGGKAVGGGNVGGDLVAGSLMAMATKGVPMKCSYTVNDIETEGWIKGKKFRGKMQVEGKQGTGNVIMKDNCMWTWGEGEAQGVKMCFEEGEGTSFWEESEEKMENMPQGAPANVEYKCRPGVFGDEKFTPPTDVKFMNLDEIMQGNLPDTLDFEGMEQ